MRRYIESASDGFDIYSARRPAYDTGQTIPFRVSPEPLSLSSKEQNELMKIGEDVVGYMTAADELYRNNEQVKTLLDTGKPEIFTATPTPTASYLFLRPDIIITPAGFSICEIETSPFGLALAEILNQAYRSAGVDTMVDDNTLKEYVKSTTNSTGQIVYSNKTASYAGQLGFLGEKIFSGQARRWSATSANDLSGKPSGEIYRAFYLAEYGVDAKVIDLTESAAIDRVSMMPSLTPHMEEKAVMALLWDRRFQDYFISTLGSASVTHLKSLIPPTWIVGHETNFSLGMPGNATDSLSLAELTNSRRKYVLKPSGFHSQASWSEGVHMLHKKSHAKALELIKGAMEDQDSLYVVQEFTKATELPMSWDDIDGTQRQMNARVRLTPYYGMLGTMAAKLIGLKATCCENTDYIHAGSSSINTAVR